MKKVFLLALIVLVSVSAFSQIKFGLKVGAATTTVPEYNLSTGTNNIVALKNAAWGFQGGAFVRLTLLGIYLQPELVFASNSYDFNVTTVSGTALKSQKFDKLEIPVLLGFKLGPIRINAGPSATIQIGSPKALISDPNFKQLYNSATFGFEAGAGFDLFKKLTFDIRYGGSLSKRFGNAVTIGSQTFKLDAREPTLSLCLGWMF